MRLDLEMRLALEEEGEILPLKRVFAFWFALDAEPVG
jgi:hypothetical protein